MASDDGSETVWDKAFKFSIRGQLDYHIVV